ncbi:hypothetical protein JRC04_22950 [Mycolicibacterium sp. S2-37]|uniref:hypothetical protein n=1 Tax=Mycolicibacterium sp. S2-37 TaxID=2810297 RepID=UPI001A9469CB|nr:hypothetical protein [Mycolicibacterium sp. S2-37]MBO0680334.1 hypothetical protein [Mycolicibacterium sp. S2-37]
MARFSDDLAAGIGPNVYAELLDREEEVFDRRGGRLVLVRDGRVVRQRQPGPMLAALRAGQPVEVDDWRIPKWARPGGGPVRNVRVLVHPDGWVQDLDEDEQ